MLLEIVVRAGHLEDGILLRAYSEVTIYKLQSGAALVVAIVIT